MPINERIKKRREYVKTRIDARNINIHAEVKRIARDLFISERTVYRDLYHLNVKKSTN